MAKRTEITNTDSIIDSRDVSERIDYLKEAQDAAEADGPDALAEWQDGDEAEELARLRALEDAVSSSEWRHGLTLIHENYFEDHARELAEDIHGNEIRNESWPFDYIDWEAAAAALQSDYSCVDFDGETYWYQG